MSLRTINDPSGLNIPLVERLIGMTAYDIVKFVAMNMDDIKEVVGATEQVGADKAAVLAALAQTLEAAAEASKAKLLVQAVNNTYFEDRLNPPPVDAENNDTYWVHQNKRLFLARNVNGVGVETGVEFITEGFLENADGGNIGFDPDQDYTAGTIGAQLLAYGLSIQAAVQEAGSAGATANSADAKAIAAGQAAEAAKSRENHTGTQAISTVEGLRDELDWAIRNVRRYGAKVTNTAVQNLAAFKAAVAACEDGDVLDVPPGQYQIDVSGGLPASITINKRITIRIRGDLILSGTTAPQDDPSYLFNLVASGSGIVGPGRIIGEYSAVAATSSGYEIAERTPGLVRLIANYTFVRGVTFINGPKCSVMVYGTIGCEVSGCHFTGGIRKYFGTTEMSQTAYFGVYLAGGSQHILTDNFFYPDADGGMVIQCFFGYFNRSIITNNQALRPYEKLIYNFGSENICSYNQIIGNDGFVPGTNAEGTIGAVIRFHGGANTIQGNYIGNCGGGIVCWDGPDNQILNNQIIDVPVGIGVINAAGSGMTLSRTRIEGNTIKYKGLLGSIVADGILVDNRAPAPSEQVLVKNNLVSGFSITDPIANVEAWQANTNYGVISTIKPTAPNANGRVYDAKPGTAGGTSGATEPAWNGTAGSETEDGSIIWVARAYGSLRDELNVVGVATGKFINSDFSGNTFGDATTQRAMTLEYVENSVADGNKLTAVSVHHREVNCAGIDWRANKTRGAGDKKVVGMSTTSTDDRFYKTWTPSVGAGIITAGTVTFPDAYYTINQGVLEATIRVESTAAMEIGGNLQVCSLPPGFPAVRPGTGSFWNYSATAIGNTMVIPSVNEGAWLIASPIASGPATFILTIRYAVNI